MNCEIPEIPNPLHSAKLVGYDVEYESYARQVVARGHSDYSMGRSDLVDFAACPSKWMKGGGESEETEATEWGKLVERLIQYPAAAKDEYAVQPAEYDHPKEGRKPWNNNATVCRDWRKEQESAGREVIKAETWTQANNAVKFFYGDHELSALLEASRCQAMVVGEYRDKETGLVVPVKGLIDLVPGKDTALNYVLADIKTTVNAHPFVWGREIHKRHYYWQAALYLDLWNLAMLEKRYEFKHAIQESCPPWQCGLRFLSEGFIRLGRLEYRAALQRYCQCLKERYWPGYETPEAGLCVNGWLVQDLEPYMIK